MHTYPAWKVWLVAIVLLAALVLALPNVFGEAPALQLSRNDRKPVVEASRTETVSALAAKGVPVEASYLDGDRAVLRFNSVGDQLKARDLLQESSGKEF